ncbi:MAG TPA: MotA/TolQ/ExbB proton channel family protein [Myxococcota bacterium]|nr:MotA/TolQ/ExbB proton channel family protein [Myxococcota bacterium]
MEGQHESAVLFALQHMTKEGLVTMSLLILMSLASWTIIMGKSLGLRKARRLADHFYDAFAKSQDPFELVGQDKEFEGAPPYSVYDYACREMQKQLDRFAPKAKANGSRRAPGRVLAAIRAAMERGIGDESVRLQGGMVILALAISGGPFIGLTGTVFGVMETFGGVAQAGQANLSAMAPGVAGALINTVAGLIVAIPSLFAYNMLSKRIEALSLDMSNFASELEATFVIDYVDAGGAAAETAGRRDVPGAALAATH